MKGSEEHAVEVNASSGRGIQVGERGERSIISSASRKLGLGILRSHHSGGGGHPAGASRIQPLPG